MSAAGEPLDERTLVRSEPRRLACRRILGHPLRPRRRGYRDRAAAVAERPLEQSLTPALDAVLAQRLELIGPRRAPHERASAERPHHEHADAELLGEWQDLSLD